MGTARNHSEKKTNLVMQSLAMKNHNEYIGGVDQTKQYVVNYCTRIKQKSNGSLLYSQIILMLQS